MVRGKGPSHVAVESGHGNSDLIKTLSKINADLTSVLTAINSGQQGERTVLSTACLSSKWPLDWTTVFEH